MARPIQLEAEGRFPPEVVRWRSDRLKRAGFSARLARSLAADAGYDLHMLLDLVERGCSPALAARITAPLEMESAPQ